VDGIRFYLVLMSYASPATASHDPARLASVDAMACRWWARRRRRIRGDRCAVCGERRILAGRHNWLSLARTGSHEPQQQLIAEHQRGGRPGGDDCAGLHPDALGEQGMADAIIRAIAAAGRR
jgi:hypothetical protein